MKTILVVVPVTEPSELKGKMRKIRDWLTANAVEKTWTYDIPIEGDRFDIIVKFDKGQEGIAMLFKLACV